MSDFSADTDNVALGNKGATMNSWVNITNFEEGWADFSEIKGLKTSIKSHWCSFV